MVDEEVCVVLDDVLLAAQGLFGKGVGEDATHAAVIVVPGVDDVGGGAVVVKVETGVLYGGLLGARLVTVEGLPGVGGDERDLVGAEADGRAVFFVEGGEDMVPSATDLVVFSEEGGEGEVLGAGDFGQRVQVDVVDGPAGEVGNCLSGQDRVRTWEGKQGAGAARTHHQSSEARQVQGRRHR